MQTELRSNESIKDTATSSRRQKYTLRKRKFVSLEPSNKYSSDSDVKRFSSNSKNEPAKNNDLL